MKSNGYVSDIGIFSGREKMNTEVKINMTLLSKGKERICHIKEFLKVYLGIMKKNSCKEVFDMLKGIKENELRNLEGKSVLEQTAVICTNGQYFPVEDVLVWDLIYDDYDDKLVKGMIDIMLNDEEWIHVYFNGEGEFDMNEKYYGLEYSVNQYDAIDEDEEYVRILGSIRWPFESVPRAEIEHMDDVILPVPEQVIGRKLVLDDVRRYEYEELNEDAREYTKNYDNVVGNGGMEFIRFDENETSFLCGFRDEYGKLKYVVNKKFMSGDIALQISVESSENVGDVDKITKCSVHFSGFSSEFVDKYKHDADLLNARLNLFN